MVSSKKPINTHLLIETTTGYLYFVDSTDQTKLLCTKDEGVSLTTDGDFDDTNKYIARTRKIQGMCYDRTNERIWFVDCDNPSTQFDVWYLTLSTDIITEVGSYSGTDQYAFDIFYGESNHFVFGRETVTAIVRARIYDVETAPIAMVAGLSGNISIDEASPVVTGTYSGLIGGGETLFNWIARSGTDFHFWYWLYTTNNFGWNNSLAATYELLGKNQQGVTYDGTSKVSFVIKKTADGLSYYHTWEASTNTFTEKGIYNVGLMMDRNADSSNNEPFNREKGFHISEDKVYLLSRSYGNLWLISVQDFADTIIAITDTYLICNGGELYKYQDFMKYVAEIEFRHRKGDSPRSIEFTVDGSHITVVEDLFVQFIGTYTRNGTTYSDVVIFEAYVENYNEKKFLEIILKSPAESDLKRKPSGDYSGRTDEIITSLITDYCNYITAGTMSAGQAMGTITFKGDKTLKTILNNFATTDFFVWKLRPTGELDYDNGSVDTGVNYSEGSTPKAFNVDGWHPNRKINLIEVYGGIVAGVEASGDWEDEASQQLNGIIVFIHRDATLDTDALCDTTASQLGSREGASILQAELSVLDTTKGLLQVGEEITFSYSTNDITIASAQFVIDDVYFDGKKEIAEYKATNGVIFSVKQKSGNLPEENSQLIQQVNTTSKSHIDATNVHSMKDEDDMASDSAVHTASQQSVKAYADNLVKLEYDDDDPAAVHIDEGDLTINGNWHECDLDSFITVPDGAIGFFANVEIEEPAASYYFKIRATFQSNAIQAVYLDLHVASQWERDVVPIPLDSNHKFDYFAPNGLNNVEITVLWWIY